MFRKSILKAKARFQKTLSLALALLLLSIAFPFSSLLTIVADASTVTYDLSSELNGTKALAYAGDGLTYTNSTTLAWNVPGGTISVNKYTLTFTNNSGYEAILSFKISSKNRGTISFSGVSSSSGKSHSISSLSASKAAGSVTS